MGKYVCISDTVYQQGIDFSQGYGQTGKVQNDATKLLVPELSGQIMIFKIIIILYNYSTYMESMACAAQFNASKCHLTWPTFKVNQYSTGNLMHPFILASYR